MSKPCGGARLSVPDEGNRGARGTRDTSAGHPEPLGRNDSSLFERPQAACTFCSTSRNCC
jgi:hypothetical protein